MKQAIPIVRLICSALFVVSAGCGGEAMDDLRGADDAQGNGKPPDNGAVEQADAQSPEDEGADLADERPPDDKLAAQAGDEELSDGQTARQALEEEAPEDQLEAAAEPCAKFLDKNKIYRARWTYTTDDRGRAHIAQAGHLYNLRTRARTPCETTVGGWGGVGFDGSHLIAATLDGISQRYNLVPFPKIANVGPMKVFENLARDCMSTQATLNPQVDNYTVVAVYNRNNTGVIPDRIQMSMDYVTRVHNTIHRSTIRVNIPNSTSSAYMKRLSNDIRKQGRDVGCRS
ncbi:DNA/RNA non-specific endonuclease [Pendulispora brunnea]|uniref:DNA/RNA non-specific endonuclease n=1 Tax=Pendulispora brunnea TaxID=2905690 RepID=A0ABZ2KA25_9BACT